MFFSKPYIGSEKNTYQHVSVRSANTLIPSRDDSSSIILVIEDSVYEQYQIERIESRSEFDEHRFISGLFAYAKGTMVQAPRWVTVLGSSAKINPFFFHRYFKLDDTQKKIYAECVNGSTNQIELSKEKLSQIELIVPPMELQNQFAAFVRQSDKSKYLTQKIIRTGDGKDASSVEFGPGLNIIHGQIVFR